MNLEPKTIMGIESHGMILAASNGDKSEVKLLQADTVEEVLEQEFDIRCNHKRLRLPSLVGTAAEMVDSVIQATGFYEQRIHVLGEMNKTIACRIDKARSELGYAPRFSLRQGMVESIRWCVENGQHI